jgi:predicted outer membrane repeat protein
MNRAYDTAGVLFVTTESTFNIMYSEFTQNRASTSSTIDVLGSSPTITNYLTQCIFENN